MEINNSLDFKDCEIKLKNNIITKNLPPLPEGKKPIFTIQDSYMQFYLGGMALITKDEPVEHKRNLKNEDVYFKNKMNTYLETMTQKDEIQSSLSEVAETQKSEHFEKYEKFTNKKHHRQKKEIDPLDLTTFRLKGQFIKNERGPPVEETNKNKHNSNIVEVANPYNKIVHEKIEIQADKKEGNVISRSAQLFGRIDIENSNISQSHLQSQSRQSNLEDDGLIPLAIRNKLKNKK